MLHLDPHVFHLASSYLLLRAVLLPLQLGNTAVNGILQGYRRVGTSAALVTLQEAGEIAGSVAVLRFDVGPVHGLQGLGVVQLSTAAVVLVAGLCCVVGLPPVDMPEGVVGWCGKGVGGGGVDDAPLLRDRVQECVCVGSGQEGCGGGSGGSGGSAGSDACGNHDNVDDNVDVCHNEQQSHWWDFIVDGGNMLIRSLCLQVCVRV